MRRYTDPVEVRQGPLDEEARGLGAQGAAEGPEQFVWRGRLWKVRAVLAHWVETGPWWQSPGVRAVLGSDDPADPPAGQSADPDGRSAGTAVAGDLLQERELWRVEAGRGPDRAGVFDLSFDWSDGRWQLVGCAD